MQSEGGGVYRQFAGLLASRFLVGSFPPKGQRNTIYSLEAPPTRLSDKLARIAL